MPPVKNLLDIVSCKNFGGSVLLHGSCVRTESLSPPILSSTYAPRIKTRRNLFFDKVKPCAALWINAISKAKPPFLTDSALFSVTVWKRFWKRFVRKLPGAVLLFRWDTDAPGGRFALSRRRQGFKSPWGRQSKQRSVQVIS